MALSTAATHKATADGNLNYTYTNISIFDDIEAEVAANAGSTPPVYDSHFSYPCTYKGVVEQPDKTTITCDLFIAMLRAKGYTVAWKSEYGTLKIHLKLE